MPDDPVRIIDALCPRLKILLVFSFNLEAIFLIQCHGIEAHNYHGDIHLESISFLDS